MGLAKYMEDDECIMFERIENTRNTYESRYSSYMKALAASETAIINSSKKKQPAPETKPVVHQTP